MRLVVTKEALTEALRKLAGDAPDAPRPFFGVHVVETRALPQGAWLLMSPTGEVLARGRVDPPCPVCGGPEHEAVEYFGLKLMPCPAVPRGMMVPAQVWR